MEIPPTVAEFAAVAVEFLLLLSEVLLIVLQFPLIAPERLLSLQRLLLIVRKCPPSPFLSLPGRGQHERSEYG